MILGCIIRVFESIPKIDEPCVCGYKDDAVENMGQFEGAISCGNFEDHFRYYGGQERHGPPVRAPEFLTTFEPL
jgi:hypothetical protein